MKLDLCNYKGAVCDRLDAWRGDNFEVPRCAGLGKARATSNGARCGHRGGAVLARR
jgi:hypothetical protein